MLKIDEETVSLIKKKCQEMKSGNISEDYLDKKILGKIKVFINKKPKFSLFSIEVETDQVYLGTEKM